MFEVSCGNVSEVGGSGGMFEVFGRLYPELHADGLYGLYGGYIRDGGSRHLHEVSSGNVSGRHGSDGMQTLRRR